MKIKMTILFSSLFSIMGTVACEKKMPLYIFYTPSHEKMYQEWFLASLPVEDDFEIIEELYKQECHSGNFMQSGWITTMIHKVDLVLRGIKENWGSIFIHSDVDIQFFKPIKSIIVVAMEGKDMVLQRDNPDGVICAGFFACRGNEKTYRLWNQIKMQLQEEIKRMKKQRIKGKSSINDQTLLNKFIRTSNPFNILWDYLPSSFFSGGTLTGKRWEPGSTLPIPDDLVMHHANWTVGIDHKIAQLVYVRSEVEKRQQQS